MKRPRKISVTFIGFLAAASLTLAGCSNPGNGDAASADQSQDPGNNSATDVPSGDEDNSVRPGADGSTLRYVFTLAGSGGTAPGEEADFPQSEVDAAASELRERFAALGRPDAVTVDGNKIIVETAGLADDLLYMASLASLNVQVRQVKARIAGDGNFAPKPGPDAIRLVETNNLTQGWIDDVSDRNCIDPLKMSIAIAGAPNDSFVAYCVPVEFVKEFGTDDAVPTIEKVEKVIFGPAIMSNTDIEKTEVSGQGDDNRIEFVPKGSSKSKLEAEMQRINSLPSCEVTKKAPSVEEVNRGCGELSVLIDGLALVIEKPEAIYRNGTVEVPFSFIGWRPQLVSEAGPIFSLPPLNYTFQRIE